MITYLTGFRGSRLQFLTRILILAAACLPAFAQAPAPGPLVVTGTTANTITLSWNDVSSDEDGFRLRRLDPFLGQMVLIATIGPDITTYRDTGLLPDQGYYYEVTSFNAAGESSPASAFTAATPIPAPYPFEITDVTANTMRLTWTDLYSDEDGFRVERYDDFLGVMVPIATVGPNVTTYLDTGLTTGQFYFYEVLAFNEGGDSYRAFAFAQAAGTAAPEPLVVTAVTANTVALSWNDAFSDEDGFHLYRFDTAAGQMVLIATLSANVTTYLDTGLTPGLDYYYEVAAFNAGGESLRASVHAAPIPIPAPEPLVVNAVTANTVRLTWNDIYDNEDGFRVERHDPKAGVMVVLAQLGPNVTTYLDTALTPGAAYYYEVLAYNSGGDSYRASVFTQATPIPAPEPLVIQGTTANTISLSWSDIYSDEDGFRVRRYDPVTAVMVTIAVLPANVTEYLDNGLQPGQTYYYEVVAYNSGGESYSANVTAQASPIPSPGPLVVTGVTANTVRLSWNDIYSDEEGFRLKRFDWTTDSMVLIATLPANTTSHLDTGLVAGETYYYEIVAYNSGGESYPANVSAQPTPIPAPDPLVKISSTATTIGLGWNDIYSNEDGFRVERSEDGITFVTVATLPENQTNFVDSGLVAERFYSYRVAAFNSGGDSFYTTTLSAGATPVPAPDPLTISSVTANQISLTWNDIYSNEDGFRLERSTDSVNFSQVATLTANTTTYIDGAVLPSTFYVYRVAAFNAGGDSYFSMTANATTPPLPPFTPAELSATALSQTSIKLRWTDVANNEASYTVERSSDGVAFIAIATLPANTVQYIDESVSANVKQYYRVRASNAGGDSPYSNVAFATTPDFAPAAPTELVADAISTSQISLTWIDNASNESGFQVERSSDGVNFSLIATLGPNAADYTDSGLSESTAYSYRVRAKNSGGFSPYSNISGATTLSATAPATPTGLASVTISATRINLSWNDVANNEMRYFVEARNNGTTTIIAELDANTQSYSATGLNPNTRYTFRVRCGNAAGNSGFSLSAAAKTLK